MTLKRFLTLIGWLFLFIVILLSACSPGFRFGRGEQNQSPAIGLALTAEAPATLVSPQAGAGAPEPTGALLPSPTPPGAPAPEATSTPAPAPTSTPTVTPTAAPTLHPMSIQAMRQGVYPGGEITIEENLEPGVNYNRYYVSYPSEGLTIYALLTVPAGEPPATGWPGIVFNHGYIPPEIYRTTERYIAYVDTLARHGYIVFRIDYRGHDRSEGVANGAYGDPGYTVDVLNAVASLKRFPQADPERIGMWGHSMGGYLTLRAMVITPDIKAGVIWAGVVADYPDLLTRWRRGRTPVPGDPRSWRSGWVDLYGGPDENPEFWASISANTYLADLSGPLQLHHGTADDTVPVDFSARLFQQLGQLGATAEFYTYNGDDHNISGLFNDAMTRTIFFYDKYLKGGG
jgi:fermentation-respiration switch protein FrsA (DUF1100 family)